MNKYTKIWVLLDHYDFEKLTTHLRMGIWCLKSNSKFFLFCQRVNYRGTLWISFTQKLDVAFFNFCDSDPGRHWFVVVAEQVLHSFGILGLTTKLITLHQNNLSDLRPLMNSIDKKLGYLFILIEEAKIAHLKGNVWPKS